ncbi:hypothetical protein GGS20DRAFT_583608 [Poronia punctata]|nr:hypothetical protein GGS20DRAFT_583608 [Poronia punctata]
MAAYPVCCVARLPISFLNKVLDEALAGSEELAPNSEHELSIVVATSDGSSRVPDEARAPPLGDNFAPFVAGSVEDAGRHHVGGAPYFAVLDQQSANDDTAILVRRQESGSFDTARVTLRSAQIVLISLTMATLGFEEVQTIADSQGGVYGRPRQTPRKGRPAPPKELRAE